ncbi:exopolysaccharide biosynthesis protein [Methylohalobius crimeensis]|uniref:exopolysaccharide biosynthesis protein n=1 Tax=Methylohalobius crimeensis TaxID=244365 RepID=UPI001377707F|nr:exopolysaccharide biosynthesis protein [Methylohalobius crimeensis]
MTASEEEAPLNSVLDEIKRSGGEDTVSLGEVLDAFQHRSLGVLLTTFGVLAAVPVIGGIPGAPAVLAALIVISVVQSLVGKGSLWMPRFLRNRKIGRDKLERGIEAARPWLGRIDTVVNRRLTLLSAGWTNRLIISLAAALLALSFFPLGFIPYGTTAPSLGIVMLGLGLMARDGLLVLVGYTLAGVTVYILLTAL